MNSERLCELAEAWTLGALDEADARAFEAHVPGCPDCPELLRSYREVSAQLALAAPPAAPPPALRRRVLARAAGGGGRAAAAAAPAGFRWRWRPASRASR